MTDSLAKQDTEGARSRLRRQSAVVSVFASFALAALAIYLMVIGQPILLPFVIAVFIVILLDSMAARFCSLSIAGVRPPGWAGMTLSILVMLGALFLLGDIIASNVAAVTERAPSYQQNIQAMLQDWTEKLGLSAVPSVQSLAQEIDVAGVLRTAAAQITAVAGNIFTILFYVVFILLEQATFKGKIQALFRDEGDAERVRETIRRISRDIQRYIGLKTAVSALTGLLSYAVMAFVGVDFAGFWAVLIFVLNFIPYIGSLVGVAFPSVLALIQFPSPIYFVAIAGVLTAVQVTVGNVVEPRLMGRSLNLSPLVILLSLAVFGSIWGIVGMVLSIPFMVIAMLICAQFEPTRAVAVLLSADGKGDDGVRDAAVELHRIPDAQFDGRAPLQIECDPTCENSRSSRRIGLLYAALAALCASSAGLLLRHDDRRVLNGIFYILRTGSPWRDLPERYGPYTTAYNRFNRWAKAGVWLRVFEALSERSPGSLHLIDSSIVRAHQHAAGGKKGARITPSAVLVED
eukprot:g559.t1